MGLTSIPLDPVVRDRIKTYGAMGDTYNKILTRLMDEFDRERFVEWMHTRAAELDAGNAWVDLDDVDWE